MISISADRIAAIEARRDELQAMLTRSDLAPEHFVALSKEYAELEPVARAAGEVRRLRAELDVLSELVSDSGAEPEIREMAVEEVATIRDKLPEAEHALAIRLLPRDSADDTPGDARDPRRHRRRRGGAVRGRPVPHVRALCRRAGLAGRADLGERRRTSAASRKSSPT